MITTAYMKATQRWAIDELIRIGAKVKISYDSRRTRLHAKARLIRRNTGFSTAFVGSSNLSAAAQLDGLEWNVRLSKVMLIELMIRLKWQLHTKVPIMEFMDSRIRVGSLPRKSISRSY